MWSLPLRQTYQLVYIRASGPIGTCPLDIEEHTWESHHAWVYLLEYAGYEGSNISELLRGWLQWMGYYDGPITSDPLDAQAILSLQTFLNANGFYTGALDGIRGPQTIWGEKAYLNDQRSGLS